MLVSQLTSVSAHAIPQQGFPYLIRMAAKSANQTLGFTSSEIAGATDGSSHLKVSTLISAGGMTLGKEKIDERDINGTEFEELDGAIGAVVGRLWWSPLSDLALDFNAAEKTSSAELNFLKGFDGLDAGEKAIETSAWRLKDGEGVDGSEEVIRQQILAKKSGAVADHVWGFETGFGEGEEKALRRYTRRVLARKDGKVETVKLVYDYLGPN